MFRADGGQDDAPGGGRHPQKEQEVGMGHRYHSH